MIPFQLVLLLSVATAIASHEATSQVDTTGTRETQAQPRQVPTDTIEQFMETVRITEASFSADGETILFTSDASGVPNAYEGPLVAVNEVARVNERDLAARKRNPVFMGAR